MSILLFGARGQVGRALVARLGDAVSVAPRERADFNQPACLARIIRETRPAVVINAAAHTAVDGAEDDEATAMRVNAEALAHIGAAAAETGALCVHYSTDYVFAGTGSAPHRETDPTGPLSVYGRSKLAGEEALAASGARHVIVRTSWVHAPEGRNFPLTILRLARERETLDVVADQVGAPTPADLIAEVSARLVAAGAEGLFHLAPAGETSWHGFARLVVEEAWAAGAVLRLRPEAIRPIAARDWPMRAPRPANSRLDTTRLRDRLAMDLPPWQEGVRRLVATLRAEGRL